MIQMVLGCAAGKLTANPRMTMSPRDPPTRRLGKQKRDVKSLVPDKPEQGLLAVTTLNLQYYASFPKDEAQGVELLREAILDQSQTDVICVQEGVAGRDVLGALGYGLCVCSGERGVAQSVRDMVYSDAVALQACDPAVHDKLLCNQIYLRQGSAWKQIDQGVMQISSDHELLGSNGRAQGKLAVRSVVWTKLHKAGGGASDVLVLNTHISGGRFEDLYFAQQLEKERELQPQRCMSLFKEKTTGDDVGILVGDFNATTQYNNGGAMHCYFKFSIANSDGVKVDVSSLPDTREASKEELFAQYMVSPFHAIEKRGWTLAYGEEIGITSAFGHVVDHMATSRPLEVVSTKLHLLTNQKVGQKPKDVDVPVTDHNAVTTVFSLARNGPKVDRPETAPKGHKADRFAQRWKACGFCKSAELGGC
mmetsp:Transcript_69654/g.182618  ORF Transcript_69654/g.182618 Transcript_69654/m.182618 type:complete len:421 (-) Transcript_69654:409-1671(-)